MDEDARGELISLAERFEEQRPRLRGVAYRMLGSLSEADDALQEAWIRISRAGAGGVENLPGWLTTVVARICLNFLRSRRARHEEPLDRPDRPELPELAVGEDAGVDPEEEAVLADSVGLALLVVLDTLTPAERVAFVLHDLFAVPFDEIGPMLERSPTAARQLASRARRRVRGASPASRTADLARQRRVVEAFLAATRQGDFEALLTVLDPDVVLRADAAAGPTPTPFVLRGAQQVAKGARLAALRAARSEVALVDGSVGLVMPARGRLAIALSFTIVGDHITQMDVIADADRLASLELAVLD
ncbi:sigma-70 family RNA polymerase sigma factor family protein [Flindersiella endophytica]